MRAFLAAAAVGLFTSGAVAQTYLELGDTGDLPFSAQDATGFEFIGGTIATWGDADMYAISLTGGGDFSAQVTAAGFDSQLFLFDSSGRGVYANDDIVGGIGTRSLLPAGHALTPTAAGTYYLAVTRFNNDPTNFVAGTPPDFCFPSPSGDPICFGGTPDSGGLIFPNGFRTIEGPTGPGGLSPLTHWTEASTISLNASYTLALTGVVMTPIPEPEAYALLLAGLGLLAFTSTATRRRR